MAGIAGLWRNDDNAVDPEELRPMLAAMSHRGPDAFGTWHEAHGGLGHCLLSPLVAEPARSRPMMTADGEGVVVYDGEIYNHAELRRELEEGGATFEGAGDTEVVLQALHRWGPAAAVPRFNGMFALAYVDRRARSLWLARDRVGVKPLVTAWFGETFVFASEAKALIAHPRGCARASRMALMQIVLEQKYCGQLSLLERVEAVETGSIWKVTRDGVDRQRYFDVPRAIDIDRLLRDQHRAPRAFVAEFEAKLRNSVERRLASDTPLALTCSGGIDSSLITAFARQSRRDVVAYVVDAPPGHGEGGMAERVTRHLGVALRRVQLDREHFLRLWPRAVWHGSISDRPPNFPNAPASLALGEACRKDGFKALLMGQGADELFGEQRKLYRNYRSWRRLSWMARLMPKKQYERERGRRLRVPLSIMAGEGDPILHARLGMTMDGYYAFLGRRLFDAFADVESIGDRAFLADCLLEFCTATPWVAARHERMAMASSLVVRFPFLDNDVIDFAINLPIRAKLHRGTNRWVAEAAVRALFPRNVVAERKSGYAIPRGYYDGTEKLLSGGLLADTLGWSSDTTAEVVSALEPEGRLKFFAVGLELWLRLYIAGETTDDLSERLVALAATRS